MQALARLMTWLLKKLTFGVLLLVAGVACFGLWIFVRDNVDLDLRRSELLRALAGEARKIEAAVADVEARMAQLRTEVAAQERRAVDASRVAREVEVQSSGFGRITLSSEQLAENNARLERMRRMEADSRKRIIELEDLLTRAQWEKDGLQIALGRVALRRDEVAAEVSKVEHYAREAWNRYGRHVVAVVLVYFLGPPLWRLTAFFVVAPFISGRRPARFGSPEAAPPKVETSRAALEVELAPGEVLWIKEKFLQASDEALQKRTRTVLDWRIPFTCAATGLTELIEMRNTSAGEALRATFSSQQDLFVELAVVSVPEGSGMVVRPRFVAGLIGDGRARIRRHWRLFAVQACATGQFRHFEFVGPCRLLLAGGRGVRAEALQRAEGGRLPARRANREATIGFTPGLAYRPVRAETFWAYLRGMNPLFDDLFEGEGVFLCQETSAPDPRRAQTGGGGRFWDGLLRVFGV